MGWVGERLTGILDPTRVGLDPELDERRLPTPEREGSDEPRGSVEGELELAFARALAFELEHGAGFHKELTGADNIVTYAAALGLSKSDLRSRWSDIVKFADIGDVLDKPMKHYSTGMQARLALSVCLCGDFDVLLLDEALSVGDQAFRHKVNKRLHEFHANGGTLLMVSHDLDQLKYLCSRTIWLRNGSIAMDGETRDVLTMYKKEG